MKIALIGYGKMGRLIEKIAQELSYEVIAKIDPAFSNQISLQTVGTADVCIDFTTPDSVVNNVRALAPLKKQLVIGTTGWEKDYKAVEKLVKEHGIGLIYDANFSIGMHCFLEIVETAAKQFGLMKGYDMVGVESHHRQKLDAPSGTAKALTEKIYEASGLQVPFTSIRCGSIPGTHTLIIDSPADTVTLTHTARSREGFARGALAAAEWVQGREGMYTVSAMVEEKRVCCK